MGAATRAKSPYPSSFVTATVPGCGSPPASRVAMRSASDTTGSRCRLTKARLRRSAAGSWPGLPVSGSAKRWKTKMVAARGRTGRKRSTTGSRANWARRRCFIGDPRDANFSLTCPHRWSAALFGKATLARAVVHVFFRIDLPHRMLTRALFLCLRRNARHARDDEQGVGDLRRNADVAADRRDRAVDVDRYRLPFWKRTGDQFDRADHLDVMPFDLELQRHLEQPRGARIARVEAVPESRDRLTELEAAVDDDPRGIAVRRAPANQFETGVEKLHAALDIAAVMAAKPEDTGRDARA